MSTIKVTTGPGEKSGIDKMSVALEGDRRGWPTRHFTNFERGEQRVAELQRIDPDADIERATR